jgi:hypothetical protein
MAASSTSVSDLLRTEIINKLQMIRGNFLKKSDGTTYILDRVVNNMGFGTDLLRKILNYADFKTDTTNILESNRLSGDQTISLVQKLNISGTYSSANSSDLSANIANSSLETKNFNLVRFYKDDTSNLLDVIVENYNLLRDNWGMFKTGLPVTLKGYSIDTTNNKNITRNVTVTSYSNADNSNLRTGFMLDTVVDDDAVNLFVAQRMLLLVVLITEIYTAMKLYENSISSTETETALSNLMLNKINILLQINENSSNNSAEFSSSYTKAYQTYKNSQGTINDTKNTLETIRLDLANNKSYLDGQSNVTRRMNILSYVAYVIGAILLVSILVTMVIPMDIYKKRTVLLVLLMLIAFVSIIIYVIGRSIEKEGFIGSVTGLDQLPNYNTITAKNARTETLIYPLVLQQMLIYINDTVRIGNTVSSTQVYNNVNASMKREANYYSETTSQMKLGATKASDMSQVFYLDTTVARSRITLVISLLLIVGITAISTIIFETSQSVKNIIYTIAGIFALLAVLLYVLYTAPRVRTDAHKYYWGKPDKLSP